MQIRLIGDKKEKNKHFPFSQKPLSDTFRSTSLQLEETILQAPLFSNQQQLILGNGGDSEKPLLITLNFLPLIPKRQLKT